MKILIAIIFIIGSVSAYLDDPENTLYYIKNAITNKYLFVDSPFKLPSGRTVANNVSIDDTVDQIPNPRENSLFYVVPNNAIGPYYNIIDGGTNSTLFASEFEVGIEINSTVNKVMSWIDSDHLNSPESLWNIRHFRNDLYILNVQYGSYMYTNNNLKSPALLQGGKRLALLMPSEGGGRMTGTQWLIIRSDEKVDVKGGDVESKGEEKMAGDKGATEEKNTGGEEVAVVVGDVAGVEEKKEDEGEKGNVTEGGEKQEEGTEAPLGEEEEEAPMIEGEGKKEGDKEDTTTKDGETKENDKEVPITEVEEKKEGHEEVPMTAGEGQKEGAEGPKENVAEDGEKKEEETEVPIAEGEGKKEGDKETTVTEMEEKKELVEGPKEKVVEDGEKIKEGKEVPVEKVTEVEQKEDAANGGEIEIVAGVEEKKEDAKGDDDLEKETVGEAEGKKLRSDSKEGKTNQQPKGFDYKGWALLFNCHTTTTRRPRTTSYVSWFWPYERSGKVETTTVDHSSDWPCPGLVGVYRGTTERDEFEETEAQLEKTGEVKVENVNGSEDEKVGKEKWEWEKEHKKEN